MVTKPPQCRDVFQCEDTEEASAKMKTEHAIIAMEMIQKDTATPSVSVKNAFDGSVTVNDDIGAPMVPNQDRQTRTKF